MPTGPDILVVAGAGDRFAQAVSAEIARSGRSVALLDGPSAARLFSIHIKAGETHISPSMPIFIRASAWSSSSPEGCDADLRFLNDEAFATLWAAAYATSARVINRPSANGFIGRLTSSSFIGRAETSVGLEEYYASSPARIADLQGSIWAEDTALGSAQRLSLCPDRPVRARAVNEAAEYETVAVVGDEAFCATVDGRAEKANLGEKSRSVVQSYKLHFATMIWALDGDAAVPIRLNAEPGLADLGACFYEARACIVRDLLS